MIVIDSGSSVAYSAGAAQTRLFSVCVLYPISLVVRVFFV